MREHRDITLAAAFCRLLELSCGTQITMSQNIWDGQKTQMNFSWNHHRTPFLKVPWEFFHILRQKTLGKYQKKSCFHALVVVLSWQCRKTVFRGHFSRRYTISLVQLLVKEWLLGFDRYQKLIGKYSSHISKSL